MLNAGSPQSAMVIASALLLAAIGIFATLRRGQWMVTLLFAAAFLALAAFEAGVAGMLGTGSSESARAWAVYLARVSALASWLWLALSVVLARPDPRLQFRNAGAYLALALLGCVVMCVAAGTRYVVSDTQDLRSASVIVLGPLGKVYLMYLVVVLVAVLMNFESMLRTASATAQRRLRPMVLSFVAGILAQMLVVSSGLLFGGLRVAWMVPAAGIEFGAGAVAALSLARRRLSDMSVPVSRPVIYYSSVSLTLAGAFLLTMAVLSKVLPVLSPQWKLWVSLAFFVVVGGGGVLLTFSPRASRTIKRFIDRHFYANRYDYRREWERVSGAIAAAGPPSELCRQIETLLTAVFDAERIAVYLKEEHPEGERGPAFARVHGPASLPTIVPLDNPLARELAERPVPIVCKEVERDLDLIPLVAENRAIVEGIRAAVCAPLLIGNQLVGLLWLSQKRGDEDYSIEDVEFLGAVGRHVATALWSARQAEQLAETRQLESLHRLSTFVLHDIKNQISGLSLVLENARRHMSDPEFQRDALGVIERTVASLRELVAQVSGVARPPQLTPEPCGLRELIEEALRSCGLIAGGTDAVRVTVRTRGPDTVVVDRRLMLRVLTNLVTNARESLAGPGEIEVEAEADPGAGNGAGLRLSVRDTGRGMTEEFVRTSLFRPFSTTKAAGLGIGLSQCRSIVEAHHGTIRVESEPGRGTRFEVRLPLPAGAPAGAGGAP